MDRRIVKTKTAIQEAYFNLLMENRPGKITISEIARRANIDRKTFYLHYDSIEDIVREFTRSKADELIQNLKPTRSPEHPFRIARLFELLSQMEAENQTFFQLISTSSKFDYFFEQIKELLVSAMVDTYKVYYCLSDVQLEVYAEFYISGILSTYVRFIRKQLTCPVDELAALVNSSTYDGLSHILATQQRQQRN